MIELEDLHPHRVICGRAEDFARSLPTGSVSLILTDPPYNKVKDEAWDRQWKTDAEFLAWVGSLCAEWRRVLAPSGSIYVFASPRSTRTGPTLGSRVEMVVGEHFRILSRITWRKPPYTTRAEMYRKVDLRSPFQASEVIIFGEQLGAEDVSGIVDPCFVFEPLRLYFKRERDRSGLSSEHVQAALAARSQPRFVLGHAYVRSQWKLPTRELYEATQAIFNQDGAPAGAPYFTRSWDDLRAEFESLRRPYRLEELVPYTDVWDYAPVMTYAGKHVCEKPQLLAEHVVKTSSRPGEIVCDFFSGSGVFLAAAAALGRVAMGCDFDPKWARSSADRVRRARITGRIDPVKSARPQGTLSLPAQLVLPGW